MKRLTKYVGLDVHQATTVNSVRDEAGRMIAWTVLPTEAGPIVEYFRGNTSKHPLYAPMTLRLDADSRVVNDIDVGTRTVQYPSILGATNGKKGPGAEFDLTPLMGNAGVIEPGEATGALVLRVQPKDMTRPPLAMMCLIVSAGVPR
jgi:hypothetical protein